MEEIDIITWIRENLSSKRKVINPNYTRNNFKFIKTKYPEMWNTLNGRTITIDDKIYSFEDKLLIPNPIINGICIGTAYYFKNKNMQKLLSTLDHSKYISFNEIVDACISLKLSGIRLMLIAKKAYPEIYEKIKKIYKITKNESESVYCFRKNIKPLYINGTHLNFQYLYGGYSYENLYFIYINNKHNLLNMLREMYKEDSYKLVTFIKLYLPEIKSRIETHEISIHAKNIDEKIHILVNDLFEQPTCLMCGQYTKFITLTTGYHNFCCNKCRLIYTGIGNRKYRDPKRWNEYNLLVERYTNITYRKFKDIINPNNYNRSMLDHNVDHIIPRSYGYENNIDPRIISHVSNLQMLPQKVNKSKGKKIIDKTLIELIMILKESDIKYYDE